MSRLYCTSVLRKEGIAELGFDNPRGKNGLERNFDSADPRLLNAVLPRGASYCWLWLTSSSLDSGAY